jgi:hypothetical protein
MKEVFERLGINHRERLIIYSDSLDVDKSLALKKHCEEIGFIRRRSPFPVTFIDPNPTGIRSGFRYRYLLDKRL